MFPLLFEPQTFVKQSLIARAILAQAVQNPTSATVTSSPADQSDFVPIKLADATNGILSRGNNWVKKITVTAPDKLPNNYIVDIRKYNLHTNIPYKSGVTLSQEQYEKFVALLATTEDETFLLDKGEKLLTLKRGIGNEYLVVSQHWPENKITVVRLSEREVKKLFYIYPKLAAFVENYWQRQEIDKEDEIPEEDDELDELPMPTGYKSKDTAQPTPEQKRPKLEQDEQEKREDEIKQADTTT